jgi:sulfatase modifying factor 1
LFYLESLEMISSNNKRTRPMKKHPKKTRSICKISLPFATALRLGMVMVSCAALLPQAHAVTITHGGNSVDIDFVDIGNASNAADTTGYGAVSYDYKIGTFEVTAQQWAAVSSFDANVEDNANDPWSGLQPTGNVSWNEAAKFANWLTSGDALLGAYQFSDANTLTGVDRDTALTTYGTIYVLPTEDEWYKAAYFKSDGSGYTTYATGNATPDGIDFAGDTSYDSVYRDDTGFNNNAPLAVGGGTIENNGTYDMGGNLYEYTESAFDGVLNDPTEQHAIRGGFYNFPSATLASSDRGIETPGGTTSQGFRIASLSVVPEPSSIALLGLGLGSLLLRRKRS